MPLRNYRQISTGKQVKGVTTILSLMAKPALLFWAYKQGMSNFERLMKIIAQLACDQEPQLQNIIKNFQTTGLYDKRDKAADAGTLAHSFIENHLKGLPEPSREGLSKDVIDKAEGCYLTFLDWEKVNIRRVIYSELAITSEKYPFGGTIDHMIEGSMTPKDMVDILDIKTGKDIYLEAKIQVKSYGELWNEVRKDVGPYIAGFHILRLGENGEFTHKYFPSLDEGYFKIFLDLLDITERLTELREKL
jgi:hypothetical protein